MDGFGNFLKLFNICRPVENPANDILYVEVWDFDPVETVKEKVTKVSKAKGLKGMKKILKEIVVTAAYGQHGSEIIGITQIPLKVNLSYICYVYINIPSKMDV